MDQDQSVEVDELHASGRESSQKIFACRSLFQLIIKCVRRPPFSEFSVKFLHDLDDFSYGLILQGFSRIELRVYLTLDNGESTKLLEKWLVVA